MATINPNDSQTILDIAIQTDGGLDNIVSLLLANLSIPNINYRNLQGMQITYTPSTAAVPVYFQGKNTASKYPVTVLDGDFDDDFNIDYL